MQRPKNFVNTISHKPIKGISPNFSHRYTGIWLRYAGCLLGAKVNGQGHSRQ